MYRKIANRTLAALGISLGLIVASVVTLEQTDVGVDKFSGAAEMSNVLHTTVTVSYLNKVLAEENTLNLWSALLYLSRYHGPDAYNYVKKGPEDRAADALAKFEAAVKTLDYNKILPPPTPECKDTMKCWEKELTLHPDSGLSKEQVHAGVVALEAAHIYDLANKANVQLVVQRVVSPVHAKLRIEVWLENALLVLTGITALLGVAGVTRAVLRMKTQKSEAKQSVSPSNQP